MFICIYIYIYRERERQRERYRERCVYVGRVMAAGEGGDRGVEGGRVRRGALGLEVLQEGQGEPGYKFIGLLI